MFKKFIAWLKSLFEIKPTVDNSQFSGWSKDVPDARDQVFTGGTGGGGKTDQELKEVQK